MEVNGINSINGIQGDEPASPATTVAATPVKGRKSRKRSIITFTVVSIINVALLVLLWTQLLTPAKQAPSQPIGTALGVGDISSPLIGKPMPDFTLTSLNGTSKTIHLAAFKGKPVILNFWASWCDPCNQEAPFMQKSWSQLQAQGVTLIGIDGQEGANNALQFIQKYGITYLNVQDSLTGTTAINYGVTGFPETVFINRNGIIVAKWAGALDSTGLQTEMAKMKL